MDTFVNEGIDIKLLLDLALDYLRRMLKDLDVNWGQRYKLEKCLDAIKQCETTETREGTIRNEEESIGNEEISIGNEGSEEERFGNEEETIENEG